MTSNLILKRGHHACDTDRRLFRQSEKEEKELGTSAVDDVNQSRLYCAICIFVASWDKREYVHECICCVGATVWLCVRKK